MSETCECERPVLVEEFSREFSVCVTYCVTCKRVVDQRPVTHRDDPSDEHARLAEEGVTSAVSVAERVAAEVALAGSMTTPRAVEESLREAAAASAQAGRPFPCSLHGGVFDPCSHGSRRAHVCRHAGLARGQGATRIFPGPCACHPCHE